MKFYMALSTNPVITIVIMFVQAFYSMLTLALIWSCLCVWMIVNTEEGLSSSMEATVTVRIETEHVWIEFVLLFLEHIIVYDRCKSDDANVTPLVWKSMQCISWLWASGIKDRQKRFRECTWNFSLSWGTSMPSTRPSPPSIVLIWATLLAVVVFLFCGRSWGSRSGRNKVRQLCRKEDRGWGACELVHLFLAREEGQF